MDYEKLYSHNARKMRSSEIRRLLEISQKPDVISFGGGLPNPDAFPIQEIKEIVHKILDEKGEKALQYGPTAGLKEFIEYLVDFVKEDGINAGVDNILTTVGSQQALDIVGRIFLEEGDVVIVGLPTYLGGINAFIAYGAKMVGIPLDDNGMKVDVLEEKIEELTEKGEKVKLIYTIPTFQNPAGVEMSIERRKKLIEIAKKYDLIIVEDDPYGKLRFEGEPIPPIKAMDDDGHVIYMATLSKILSPGLRLAYVVAPAPIAKKMIIAKQSMDLCTSTLAQMIAYHYIKNGYMKSHLPKIIEMYRRKRDIMLESLEEFFPPGCKWTHPRGGMFLWVELPHYIDTSEMLNEAIEKKVAYVTGKSFFVNGEGTNTMRLNFTNAADDKIREGIKRLAEVVKKRIK